MNVPAPRHGAVLLAAGASQRLGRSKQLLRRDGETLVHRAARLVLATQPQAAVIVLGADAEAIQAAVADLPIRRVDCGDWRRGMGASLRAGIDALPADCGGTLVVVCDQPALDAAHLERICAAWRARPEHAVASAYADRLGVPALLPRAWRADLRDDARGAAALLARRVDRVIAIANAALAWDVDTPDDLGAEFDEG
jgi:CTP:molybdopterin cytidylyltransferase MocA